MDFLCPVWILLLGGAGLFGLVVLALVVVVKFGVLVDYATREEEPDRGEYSLDESREADG